MSYWGEVAYVPMHCAQCGKIWYVKHGDQQYWRYRRWRKRTSGVDYYCTWSCMRAAEMEREAKRKCKKHAGHADTDEN